MKLVDQTADPNALMWAATQAARGLAEGTLIVNRAPNGVGAVKKFVLEKTQFGRDQVFNMATKGVMKMSHGNYPAPLKIIDVVKLSAEKGFGSAEGYAAEAKAFGELGVTPESAALRSIFFGQTECKKNPYPKPTVAPSNVAVIGAGLMGAGVTEVSVANGFTCTLKDASSEGLAKGMQMIEKSFATKVKRRSMTQFDADKTMTNVAGVTAENDAWIKELSKADMVIEAVFENIDLKKKIFKELEEVCSPNAVLASNTSAIPIGSLAAGLKRPENFVGMHYFSPVPKMPLLEIITHEGTSKETAAKAFEVGIKQGKTPIIVKDVPGFFVNRCLGPYTDEGVALLQSGADINDINKAMLSYGFPVGPMSLADEVGIEVAYSVGG
jgi:enoyl-CoA hydratase/long-chain 3-hydroxyacyl-CoA dehydrogenase